MPRIQTDSLITELMAARSGITLLAREIGHILHTVYNRPASPKSISKTLILLDQDHTMLNRRQTTNQEKASYNCRYIYKWGHFNENSQGG